MSKYKNITPMRVPVINNQQPMFDIKDVTMKQCECGTDYFDKVLKVGLISEFAASNETRKNIPVEVGVYICHGCGKTLDLLGDKKEPCDGGTKGE